MQVTRETHLKVAFFMWALVGLGLLIKGGTLFYAGRTMSEIDPNAGSFGMAEGIGLVIALAIGFAKGNFVLPKIARKNIARIEQLPEESPLYMTFSLKSWLLIASMMLIGMIIRVLGAPNLVRGVILVAVGFALTLGSRAYLIGRPLVPVEKRA